MVVCIAGMHRSGTSMVARLLNVCGLYLGREQDILPPNPTNPEGHWEHERIVEINDELLAEFGGGWDYPPDLSGLSDRRRVSRLEQKARAVLEQFAGHDVWGWKDPRNSLTLPFWRPLVGTMSVVICVRNPLEVALSLRRRGASSLAFGLSLWTAYNEAIMRATEPAERVVTHYLRYLADPVAETRRVGARIGLRLSDEQATLVNGTTKRESRHNYFTFADLIRAGVSTRVVDLYRQLCEEAGMCDGSGQRETAGADEPKARTKRQEGTGFKDLVGRFDYAALESHLLRKPE